jgi:2-alkyl-3-oxoalkanoate reductase
MKLLITGAGGFLGRHVVAAAVRRGHLVRAMLRPASSSIPASWHSHPQVDIVRGDLRSPRGLDELLAGVEGVMHLAAAKAGDLYEQFGGTVLATENLLSAMSRAGVNHLVVTSSFSVYEYLQRRAWSRMDETSPLAATPFARDEYCQTKLAQERLVLERAAGDGLRCVVLRPGVIYGQDNLWTARLGMQINERWWLRTGTFAPLPLTYVENCAEAVVLAAEYNGPETSLILNVVDDQTPSQREYLKELKDRMSFQPRIIPVPWTIMRLLARSAWLANHLLFKGTAKVPGLFVPSRLHARCKPLRYSNRAIKAALGWQPRYAWQEGLTRSLAAADPAELPAGCSVASNIPLPAAYNDSEPAAGMQAP